MCLILVLLISSGLQYGYPPDREDFEDLEQQAFIGIMDSVQHYDSTLFKAICLILVLFDIGIVRWLVSRTR